MMIGFDKRRHHRLTVALQLLCKHTHPEWKDYPEMQGVTENISMGGLYFVCLDWQTLSINQVLNINIEIPKQGFDLPGTYGLKTRAEVLRVEKLPLRPHTRGVALQFLEDLHFAHA